ncbi:MAG: hypothetical protein EOP88_14020 [Verrucomicrobiaceae bacterium]|nr:MAG: hypothetical protein EOP88_14020 [Verrucomicrobiaceae bacterium]
MKKDHGFSTKFFAILALLLPVTASAWQPGGYPAAPLRMYSAGFSVNNQDRNDVVAFWHAVYQASEGYESRVNWTGNYTGTNGTVGNTFLDDVERRLNYFRAMSGVSANVIVNSGANVFIDVADPFKPGLSMSKAEAAQNAALMMIRNFNPATGANPALTHNPGSGLVGWSPSAWNAAANGNFAFGLYGPGAITEYMIEELSSSAATSTWNSLVGHRRWCLYPPATDFATGDQPGSGPTKPPTNVLYVVPRASELLDEPSRGFIAYPPAGYFPAGINSPYWSLSCQGADFSSATVKMTDSAGKAVAVKSTQRNNSYGDPAIIWEVSDAAAVQSVYSDTRFNVAISGIAGDGIPTSYNYTVTLIHPDRITSNQAISGPTKVGAKGSGSFTFTPPAGAEAMQVVSSVVRSTAWKEDAENSTKAKAALVDGTGSNYPLIVKTSTFSGFGGLGGTASFRLTFPTSYDTIQRGVPEQFFELQREILPKAKCKLSFLYRRGYMTKASSMAVETSSNGGLTWSKISIIKGVSDTQYDAAATKASISLPKSSTPVRIRFRYYTTGGAIYTHEAAATSPTGIFIDDVTVKNADWLETKKSNAISSQTKVFSLAKGSAGAKLAPGDKWHLRLRTKLGGKWFAHGPSKVVTITK